MTILKYLDCGCAIRHDGSRAWCPSCANSIFPLNTAAVEINKSATVKKFEAIQAEGLAVFEKKNKDYGDSFKEDGVLGVMIRMKDKLNRFITLARANGETTCKDETLKDTLLDLHNYAAMAMIVQEEGESWALVKGEDA